MKKLTTSQMIEAGGSEWEKGSIKRIYLNDSALIALFCINDSDALKLKQTKPAKKTTYFDLYSEAFYSANGMIVRNAIRAAYPSSSVNKI